MSFKVFNRVREIVGFKSSADKAVLCQIAYCLNDESGHAYPKRSTLAQYVDITEEAVSRSISRLKSHGFLEVTRPKNTKGLGRNFYQVVIPDPLPVGFSRIGDVEENDEQEVSENIGGDFKSPTDAPTEEQPANGAAKEAGGRCSEVTSKVIFDHQVGDLKSPLQPYVQHPPSTFAHAPVCDGPENPFKIFSEAFERWSRNRKPGRRYAWSVFARVYKNEQLQPEQLAAAMNAYTAGLEGKDGHDLERWLMDGQWKRYMPAEALREHEAMARSRELTEAYAEWFNFPEIPYWDAGHFGPDPDDPGHVADSVSMAGAVLLAIDREAFLRGLDALDRVRSEAFADLYQLDRDMALIATDPKAVVVGRIDPRQTSEGVPPALYKHYGIEVPASRRRKSNAA